MTQTKLAFDSEELRREFDSWTVGERSEAILKSFFDRLPKKHRVLQP